MTTKSGGERSSHGIKILVILNLIFTFALYHCQIVITTKALSLGIHAEELRDSIAVGTADTQDNGKQDAGRAGRKEDCQSIWRSLCCGGLESKQILGRKDTTKPLDPAKVVFLAEKVCWVACENVIYDNPPPETLRMDCIQAQRPVPCDLCCTRYKLPYNPCQFPSSSDEMTLPPFTVPSTASKTRKPRKKADNLKKVELEEVERALATYEQQLYAEERLVAPHRYRPRSLYFPNALQEAIASDLLKIKSRAALNVILASNSWPFIESQGSNLFDYISSLQKTVHSQRKVKSKKSTKKSKSLSDLSDGLSDIEKSSSDIDAVNLPPLNPSKRVALAPANNQPHAKRKPQPRQAQQSLAEAESYYARPVGKGPTPLNSVTKKM
ncbi:hypothetical protein BT96DRAFT_944303 [Gymnopus androsaceus JB14]|uniref:Uncharacterized protein n=1 Tax=Gymnopus androsaceus JB14 TaxID=1447944 RepID=A0A6A4H481_9AGAR|nr:hypothetical protein BT96DRAFT_944303 [Gymnopus androsaceus JB14]